MISEISDSKLLFVNEPLKLDGFLAIDYRTHTNIGVFIELEKIDDYVTCPHCGTKTNKLHQNHEKKEALKVLRIQRALAVGVSMPYYLIQIDQDEGDPPKIITYSIALSDN